MAYHKGSEYIVCPERGGWLDYNLVKKMEKFVFFRNQVGGDIAVVMGAVVVLASF